MISPSFILLSLLSSSLVMAGPLPRSDMSVHESRTSIPKGFVGSGAAPSDQMMTLRIGLTSNNIGGLQQALLAVSTPNSTTYGQHLSKQEVEQFVAPSQETVQKVNAWLAKSNLVASVVSPAGDWISVQMPVKTANALINADFKTYTHEATGKTHMSTMSYSIPSSLVKHIDLVHPGISFPNPLGGVPSFSASPSKSISIDARDVDASCAQTITPQCLQQIYNIPADPATQTSNTLGVTGFINQFANQQDLADFLTQFRSDIGSNTTFTLETLDGGQNDQDPANAGTEANLDIQYTVGVATGVPTSFISVGNDFQDGGLEGFLDVINFLLAQDAPPSVLTTSYGQDEDTVSANLASKLCDAHAQLGARGVSILFASGDGAVSGSQNQQCSTFVPTFPSGCPFLTSVGATTGINPETAAAFSAGGFSNVFAQPDYQSTAVSTFLTALGDTNQGLFNPQGRAYPDISAQGQNIAIVVGGQLGNVAGTSASSPIVASVISLVNDRLVAAGKSPLGFLNPFLYSNGAQALNDITTGSNPGCNTNGFPAVQGWDPVTGLGTPNFDALLQAVGAQ